MLTLKTTTRFKKDYKRMKKQGKDMSLLQAVIDDLIEEKVLEAKYKDHALTGNYLGFRECHIQPDWLLIYAIDHDQLILVVARTGSHSDLFDELQASAPVNRTIPQDHIFITNKLKDITLLLDFKILCAQVMSKQLPLWELL